MEIEKASELLAGMYGAKVGGGKAIAVHLFAIRYAKKIQGLPVKEIVDGAGLPPSYKTEIRKGINLAEHVELL